jgi:hypothetical protein
MNRAGRRCISHNRFLNAVAALCCLACATVPALPETGPAMIAINQMTPGAPPTGFIFARTGRGEQAAWIVVDDKTAAAGRAIEQTSTDRTDYRFPLAIHGGVSAANLDASLRFKAVSGKVDQAGGIAVRLQDADNYYVVRANALEDNVRFYRVVHGRREQLDGANLKVSANEWHTLGLRAEGDRFTVSFEGKTLFSVADQTFAEAGGVALWTKADSVTRFDQIRISVLPSENR